MLRINTTNSIRYIHDALQILLFLSNISAMRVMLPDALHGLLYYQGIWYVIHPINPLE